ncbi:MAG: hypothetical protein U0987_06705, partial [Afipia sp.]|nr:hypothetical protein [Afipia sp.]
MGEDSRTPRKWFGTAEPKATLQLAIRIVRIDNFIDLIVTNSINSRKYERKCISPIKASALRKRSNVSAHHSVTLYQKLN